MAGMTPTPTPAADPAPTTATAPTYPPEVEAFCAEHGLRDHLDAAVRLAREVVPTMLGFTTEVEDDPESPARWVTLNVFVPPGMLGDGRTTRAYSRREAEAIPLDIAALFRVAFRTG